MRGFIEGENRYQSTLFPERIDDYIDEDCSVRVIDVFIDRLDLSGLGFRAEPADTGRPDYSPGTMLKIFVYGYMNKVQSSRRLEAEARCNVELMWLTGRLAPDFKTNADFRLIITNNFLTLVNSSLKKPETRNIFVPTSLSKPFRFNLVSVAKRIVQ